MNRTDRRRVLVGISVLSLHAAGATKSSASDSMRAEQSLPSSPFNERTTAEQVTAGLNLKGKAALVTGCNSGIGLETMRVLVLRGAHVLGVARTLDKASEACAAVVRSGAGGRATPFACEHSDFSSVVACARGIRALAQPIDMLICNAGIAFSPKLTLYHGVESQFAINHLSHFILVNHLLPEVLHAEQGRIIVVGSSAHRHATKGVEFDNLAGQRDYNQFRMYAQSKLANGLFARELARRIKNSNASANVVHPGTVETGLFKHLDIDKRPKAGQGSAASFVKNVQQGAATTCYVATSPALKKISGQYFEDCNIAVPSEHMRDDRMAVRLWAVSEELTRPFLINHPS